MNDIFVGSTPPIILKTPKVLTDASVLKIIWKKPSGTTAIKDADVYQEVYARYDTLDGEVDEGGEWEFQVYMELPTWKGYSTIYKETIKKPLASV